MTKTKTAPSSESKPTKSKKKAGSAENANSKPSTRKRGKYSPRYFNLMLYSIAENARKSGRADGNVYMRNHRIRGFAMPSNPQTAAQTVQRGNFGSLSGRWNTTLTEDQRLGWNALETTIIDRMGHSVTLSGKGLYVALNRNLFNSGNAIIDDAPTPSSPLSPASLEISSAASGSFELTFTATPIPSGITYLVFATKMFTPGTYKPSKSLYKLIAVLPGTTASPVDLFTEYTAIFPDLSTGKAVFAKVIAVKNSTGFTAPPVTARVITS